MDGGRSPWSGGVVRLAQLGSNKEHVSANGKVLFGWGVRYETWREEREGLREVQRL